MHNNDRHENKRQDYTYSSIEDQEQEHGNAKERRLTPPPPLPVTTPKLTKQRLYILLTLLAFTTLLLSYLALRPTIPQPPDEPTPQYPTTTVLFLFRDAGESYGLAPLLPALVSHSNSKTTAVVIPHGTNPYWTSMIHNSTRYPHYVLLSTLLSIDASSNTATNWQDRNVGLTPAQLDLVLNNFPLVSTIVTGAVSAIQTDIVRAATTAAGRTIRIIGFDDSVGLDQWTPAAAAPPPASWSASSLVHHGNLDALWVTSTWIQQAVINSTAFNSSPHPPSVDATGSSALWSWEKEVVKPSNQQEIQKWQQKIYQGQNRPWIHIFGEACSITDATVYVPRVLIFLFFF